MAVRISGKLPSSAGRGALPDGRRGGGTAPCEPTHLAGIPQQPRVAFYPLGGKVLYPETVLREVLEANYRKPL